MAKKRQDWTILGRHIGTAAGWDEMDTMSFILYGFEPAQGLNLPSGDLGVELEKGRFEIYAEDGSVAESFDMITALQYARQVPL